MFWLVPDFALAVDAYFYGGLVRLLGDEERVGSAGGGEGFLGAWLTAIDIVSQSFINLEVPSGPASFDLILDYWKLCFVESR